MISTQISTSLPISMMITSTTMTLKPLTKGIVIGSSVRGSSSKPPLSKEELESKGTGIKVTRSEEDKKKALEKEIEKQRQIKNIVRQRQGDPPGLEKGDPTKQYCYKTIEQIVCLGEIFGFKKNTKEEL